MHEGFFLLIKARCVPRKYNEEILDIRIESIDFLNEVKDSLIEKFTIIVPSEIFDESMVEDLSSIISLHPGKTELDFIIKDVSENIQVGLTSKRGGISVQNDLIAFLKGIPELEYKIN